MMMMWATLILDVCCATMAAAPPDVNARFPCPPSSCWCGQTFENASIQYHSDQYYRTALNSVTNEEQALYLDEWFAPSTTPRPGALIIHVRIETLYVTSRRVITRGSVLSQGGGYSAGPYNGCSHARNMSSFADRAMELARHGFVAVSIDYRCEGALRPQDEFHPWYDAVEDARAAVRYMVANAERLQLDPHRIVAFGGSAGAVTVAQMLHALPDGAPMPPPVPPPPLPPNNCTRTLEARCPLKEFHRSSGFDTGECMACTRQQAGSPICRPVARAAYCNFTSNKSMRQLPIMAEQQALTGTASASAHPVRNDYSTGGNISCGIALSGAITPESIASGQVTASENSPPYLDFHGICSKQ